MKKIILLSAICLTVLLTGCSGSQHDVRERVEALEKKVEQLESENKVVETEESTEVEDIVEDIVENPTQSSTSFEHEGYSFTFGDAGKISAEDAQLDKLSDGVSYVYVEVPYEVVSKESTEQRWSTFVLSTPDGLKIKQVSVPATRATKVSEVLGKTYVQLNQGQTPGTKGTNIAIFEVSDANIEQVDNWSLSVAEIVSQDIVGSIFIGDLK